MFNGVDEQEFDSAAGAPGETLAGGLHAGHGFGGHGFLFLVEMPVVRCLSRCP